MSDDNGAADVFVRDRVNGTTERVSVGPGNAEANDHNGFGGVGISTDGRVVAFDSEADNLVVPDTNGTRDLFVRVR